ncbi:MAG TPA: hypothetical protein VN723_02095 [Rhizomicrobium sp.]|nr:hypothetical protein [Rhizomicrobium sp.]
MSEEAEPTGSSPEDIYPLAGLIAHAGPRAHTFEERAMEIHKPHPAKTWKEFFIELGTIVAGILIALALEQSVEAWHERGLAREATEAINAEMQEDLDRIAYRQAQQPCIDRRLNAITGLLADWGQGKPLPAGMTIGQPNDIPLAAQRWQANLNSGRFSRQPGDQQSEQSAFYTRLAALQTMESREHDTWSSLAAVELGPRVLGADMRGGLVAALQNARALSSDIRQLGQQMLKTGRLAGLTPRPFKGAAIAGNTCAPLLPSAPGATPAL